MKPHGLIKLLLSIRCPRCGALPGEGCDNGEGFQTRKPLEQHASRLGALMKPEVFAP